MNRASLKVAPGGDLQAFVRELSGLGPKLMFELGPKLMSMSTEATRDFVKAASELITATLPTIEIPKLPRHCCEIRSNDSILIRKSAISLSTAPQVRASPPIVHSFSFTR